MQSAEEVGGQTNLKKRWLIYSKGGKAEYG